MLLKFYVEQRVGFYVAQRSFVRHNLRGIILNLAKFTTRMRFGSRCTFAHACARAARRSVGRSNVRMCMCQIYPSSTCPFGQVRAGKSRQKCMCAHSTETAGRDPGWKLLKFKNIFIFSFLKNLALVLNGMGESRVMVRSCQN